MSISKLAMHEAKERVGCLQLVFLLVMERAHVFNGIETGALRDTETHAQRERERERERDIYIYVERERERERVRPREMFVSAQALEKSHHISVVRWPSRWK